MLVDTPLFRRVLGASFDKLPTRIREMHDRNERKLVQGECKVSRGNNPINNIVAKLLGLPPAGNDVPVSVDFDPQGECEYWTRHFGTHRMRSIYSRHDKDSLIEKLGFVRLCLRPQSSEDGLRTEIKRVWVLGLAVPNWLSPRIHAEESEHNGRVYFDVSAHLPFTGLLVHYRGWLKQTPGSAISEVAS